MQLFNIGGDSTNALDISVHMPNLRLVAWFDQKKPELAVNQDVVDWRFSASSAIHDAFVAYLGTKDSNGNRYAVGYCCSFSAAFEVYGSRLALLCPALREPLNLYLAEPINFYLAMQ